MRHQTIPVDPPPQPLLWVHHVGHFRCGAEYGHILPDGAPLHLVFITLAGSGRFRIGHRTFVDAPGQVTLMPGGPHAMHWATAEDHWDFCWLSLKGTGALGWAAQFGLALPLVATSIGARAAADLGDAVDGFVDRATPAAIADAPAFQRDGLLLFHAVVEAVLSATRRAAEPRINGHGLLTVLEEYLARPDPRPDRVQDLARRVGARPEHVARVLRAATGLAPKEHFLRYRIRQAQALLRATDLAVAEIARRVGYPDPFHFSRLFRRRTGMTPSRYRQRGGSILGS